MLHLVTVHPVRVRGRSAELDVETVRVVGYRAVCSCDWRGGVRASWRAAHWEGRWHSGSGRTV